MKSHKKSLAKKKWWAEKDQTEKSKIMSNRVKLAWSRRTPEYKEALIAKMNKARIEILTKS